MKGAAVEGGAGSVDGEGDGDEDVDESEAADGDSGSGLVVRPVATIRHVALEPLHPTDSLGIQFRHDSGAGG